MENLKFNEAINFSEEKLMDVIDKLRFYENLEITGKITNELIGHVHTYIDNSNIESDVKFKLCDYCNDIADKASTYGYKEGFKEGIRLFKTLMKM